MDFTFIFLIILMMLAAKNGMYELAAAMLVLTFVTAKNNYAMFGAVIAGALLAAMWLGIIKEGPEPIIVGLFIIFLIAVKSDDKPPGYGGGGYQ